jgi:protocatechuate 3,4-dioxygenase alpha subunit
MSAQALKETASQTAGPYLHIGMMPKAAGIEIRKKQPGNVLARPDAKSEHIRIEGCIYDGYGALVRDAQIEIWQANSEGKYVHPDDRQNKPVDPGFTGFGRAVTDFKTGLWWFETVKPGVVPGRHARPQAPHISAIIFARGINIGLHTRIYFDDEGEKNKADPVLNLIEVAPRRETLVAKREKREGQVVYRFDVRLQG